METLYSCIFYVWISAFCRHLRDWLGVDGLSARVGEQWWCFGKVSRYEPHLLQWLEAGQASPLCLCRVIVLPLPVQSPCAPAHCQVGVSAVRPHTTLASQSLWALRFAAL